MSVRTLKLALCLVVSGFVLAAIYFTVVIAERQNALRRIARYNPTWQANQVLNEFMTLDQSLRKFKDGESDTDKEDVELRYDIFAGTINSLAEGGFRDVLDQEPSFESTIHDLEGPTNDAAPLIKDLKSPNDALAALQVLGPLQSSLKHLPSITFNYGAKRASWDHQELARLHWIFSSIVGCLILFGIALIGLLARHNSLLERTYRKMGILTADLTHLAHHDPLTGLANRALFQKRLEHCLRKPVMMGQPSQFCTSILICSRT